MVMQVIRNVQKRDEFNYHLTSVKPFKSENHEVILGQILSLKRVLKSVLVISPIVTVQNQFIDSTFDWSLSQKLRRQIFSIFPKRN